MRPMLATARPVLPVGPEWSYEFKWDGVRALIDVADGRLRILSRNANDVTVSYPELHAIADGLDDVLLDGEIVSLVAGVPSFEALQRRMHVRSAQQAHELASAAPVAFIAFDVLRLYGVDLTARGLGERRETLERLREAHADSQRHWSASPSFTDPEAVSQAARDFHLEGVVAKRLGSRYRPNERTEDWIKVKFTRRSEFVVIGWEAAAGSAATLSSLVLGYYRDGRLRLAGKVGSGLSTALARSLKRELVPTDAPEDIDLATTPGRVLTWTQPHTVVEVSYSQWSNDSDQARLRHPVFIGVRTDKDPTEVGRDE